MSLAQAISNRGKPLADAQSPYLTNVVAVNTLVTSVLTSKLPTLNSPPPDWNDFVTAYEQANGAALNWVNDVLARLLDVPDEVLTYNAIIAGLLQDAAGQAQALVDNPGNSAALAELDQDLAALSRQLGLVVTFISGAVTAIQNFQDNLPTMATNLQTIATKSITDSNADKQKIDKLLDRIQELQADIKSLTAAIVALGIADGIAITLGIAATIAFWPVGALTWFALGPAVAIATTYIALDALKIKADKAAIEGVQQEMNALTADVATLSVLAQNFQTLSDQTVAVEQNLGAILAEWQAFEGDVNAAIGDIRTAISDTSNANYAAVAADVAEAVTEWNAAYAQAGALHVALNVNDAQLELGMSSSQVKQALESGTTFDVITYYNQIG